jgi:predicted DsbA family dithiol-disulfide isomerase
VDIDEDAAGDTLDLVHERGGEGTVVQADVADPAQAIARVAGAVPDLDEAELRRAIDAGEGEPEVAAEEGAAARMGITGVPFFLAGRSVALSGAHDADTLRELIAAARQRAEAEADAAA